MTTEVEVPSWLKSLALAPEYHPTEAEFSDPIDYIFRIEQEAAQFGICKIVPPYPKAPKRVVFNNLNLSLSNSQDAVGEVPVVGRNMCPARSMGGIVAPPVVGLDLDGAGLGGKAKFTTRRQQLGWNARKMRNGVVPQAVAHKLVWQSGETYTLDQFETKAKIFARNRLGSSQEIGTMAVEALFWKASLEKAISIEYANDIPGSAFAEARDATGLHHPRRHENGEFFAENGSAADEDDISGDEGDASKDGRGIGCRLSNSAWNMRRVARSPGSLLRFIPDEVPGVTSPMVYIGMLFSWFAWHVEDHELHSLNYLHTGAPKTWYAVPGDAAPALEEVVRVQGYGGNINAQDAFARLGEKTTVMSPEVLVAAGVPCCRLVQNAGEYVVTFPRAYHLGFSHGFNCGEAANFATPGWLDVAREASVRRAAMKYLPMLSHQQLLYTLAASLITRCLIDVACEKRSSRLQKKRVGEEVVKNMFVNDVIQQNDMIGKLVDSNSASCLLVRDMKHHAPHADSSILDVETSLKTSEPEEMKLEEVDASERPSYIQVTPSLELVASEVRVEELTDAYGLNDDIGTIEREQACVGDLVISALPRDLSTLPCAACGILCYTGLAIVQPSPDAATMLRPLHSHASRPGSYRNKGVINTASGVLPGKADKRAADFHMLPNVEVPESELEGTTPENFADALYEDQTEEPVVWTPDLRECPSAYKDCSNDATLDAEIPRSGQTSERDEYFSPEVAKARSCDGNDGITMKIEKQNREIVSGLKSAVPGAGATFSFETEPVAEGTLSSLQLLAATYEGDSDFDEYDEMQHGNFATRPSPSIETPSKASSSEDQLKVGVCNALEEATMSASCQVNDQIKDGGTEARGEFKRKSALSYGECVTCSLPHDSFFDEPFDEATLKGIENGTMELEISSEKNDVVVSCDEKIKPCALKAPDSDLESNELVRVPCSSLVEAGSLLGEGSSMTADSCSMQLGEALDQSGSLATTGIVQRATVNGVRELEPMELPNLKGAARPRMLCLEHAVAAQKRLEAIGGATVIIICHSSFPRVEEQARVVAAELGLNQHWRSVPFKQAVQKEYKLIVAAVEAQEEFLPGDSDWVDQLGLSVYGQSKSLSNDVEIANGNPSSEESEEPGNRRIWKGRKEKKSSIIRQWCGRGWRADQLHRLLGGSRSTSVQIDSTTGPAHLCTSVGVSSFVETGRSRKIMRPGRLADYTPDGRAPKGESHTKKSCNKRKILLEMSEDEVDEQNSEATPSRQGGSHTAFFNLHGSSGDSIWREVPIASTDAILLPFHSSEKGHDDLFSFAPENEVHLSASEANPSANLSLSNGATGIQAGAVVGGFVQRGAKLIARERIVKICRQMSTQKSAPVTPLTTPTRIYSHKRRSATKLVNQSKRKAASELLRYSKRPRFAEVSEPSLRRESLALPRHGEVIVNNVFTSETIMMSGSDKEDIILQEDHDTTPSREDEEVITTVSNGHSETTTEAGAADEKLKLSDTDSPLVQDCNSRFLGNNDSSPSKSIISQQQYHYDGVEDHQAQEQTHEQTHDPSDQKLLPNVVEDPSSMSILMYCTESLPQGLNEPTSGDAAGELGEPVLSVPRKGRVRGKRTKSRQWKSCIEMPTLEADEEACMSPKCQTSGDGSHDPVTPSPEGRRDSGGQADPDFFPYSSGCLTSSTTRRRRVCTEWGGDKEGNGEADEMPSVQQQQEPQETKPKKRKNAGGAKAASNKRCEDMEGEFQCDMEGCIMAFDSIRDLQLHKKNLCTWKGCGKHFHMHKYLLQHRRVHLDDRPLKCPWKGCTQAFKWAWARTEHIRVHTGERPYKCLVSGCGQTFRFVSDFSRHKRNTGHRPT